MRKLRLLFALCATLAAMFTHAASAQPAPRDGLDYDNFTYAKAITIGKNYSVNDIGAATVDSGQPIVTGCGATNIYNSVWFKFTIQDGGIIYLSTEGTILNDRIFDSTDTVMAVFTGDSIGTLVQIACNNDSVFSPASELSFPAVSNTQHYIMVGTYSDIDYVPPSVLRLTTRARIMTIYPNNSDFELPLTNADWKVKNSTGDGVICSSASFPAFTGSCAIRFIGNPGEASNLVQTFAFPGHFVPRKNGTIKFFVNFRVMDTVSLGSAKITISATYSDGTPPNKSTHNLAGFAAGGGYGSFSSALLLASGKLASLKFEVKFKSTSGVLMIDNVFASYNAGPAMRDGVLALPPAK